jgi:hypothetical protein
MNSITLTADGALIHSGQAVEGDPLRFLSHGLELGQGFALRGVFEMMRRYPVLTRLDPFWDVLLQQYAGWPAGGCEAGGLACLEMGKTVEMIGFPGQPRLEIYVTLYGLAGDEPLELKTFQVESLLDIPMRLGGLKHIVFGDTVNVFRFQTVLCLFEFIEGIAWQLSFHGTPRECALRR